MAKLTGPIWTRPNWSMRPNRLGRPGLGWVQPKPDPLCPPPNLSLLSHVSVEHAAAPSSRFPFAPLMSPALSRPMWGAPTTAISRRGCAPSCSTPLSSIWFPWPQMLAHDPPGSAAPLPFPDRLRLSPAPAIWGFAPPRYPLLPPPGGFDSCGSLVHPQPETLIGRRRLVWPPPAYSGRPAFWCCPSATLWSFSTNPITSLLPPRLTHSRAPTHGAVVVMLQAAAAPRWWSSLLVDHEPQLDYPDADDHLLVPCIDLLDVVMVVWCCWCQCGYDDDELVVWWLLCPRRRLDGVADATPASTPMWWCWCYCFLSHASTSTPAGRCRGRNPGVNDSGYSLLHCELPHSLLCLRLPCGVHQELLHMCNCVPNIAYSLYWYMLWEWSCLDDVIIKHLCWTWLCDNWLVSVDANFITVQRVLRCLNSDD
jgi:hypothetical protein